MFTNEWEQLKREASGLIVLAISTGEALAQAEENHRNLTDEALAIQNLAEKEDRELSDDELDRWNSIMDEDSGELQSIESRIATLKKRDAERRRLALSRHHARDSNDFRNQFDGDSSIDDGQKGKGLPRLVNKFGRLKAFKGDNALEDAFLCGQWLKAVKGRLTNQPNLGAEQYCERRSVILDTATEGTDTAGGYLVPDPLSAAIINYREISGVSRRIARVVPMTSDVLSIPKKTGTTTVTYPGEGAAITASDQTWGSVNLSVKKRAVLSKVSQELIDDAIIAVIDDLAVEIGSDLARQEDNELVNGDGTSTYGNEVGLVSALGSAGTFVPTGDELWSLIALADFDDTMALLPAKFWAFGPRWLCSPAFYYSVIRKLEDAAGGNTNMNIATGDGATPTPLFKGYPVILTDQMPTSTAVSTTSILFGAFSAAAIIGDRMGIRIGQSSDRYFDEDVLAVRATARYDINVHEGGDASNAGAYVGLQTAAS